MIDLGHVPRGGSRGLDSSEDQVSMDVRNVVQDPKSDLMARGVDFDLPQMAKRVGLQSKTAEHEDLSRKENSPPGSIIVDG